MTVTEARELLSDKLCETRELLKKTKGGDKLDIKTSITYMTPNVGESDAPIAASSAMLANLIIRPMGYDGDEDPEFYYTIAADIKGEDILDPSKLEREYLDFDSRVIEFKEKLETADDIPSLIEAECRIIEDESRAAMAKFEASLKTLKKRGLILAGGVFLLLAIIIIIKAITG